MVIKHWDNYTPTSNEIIEENFSILLRIAGNKSVSKRMTSFAFYAIDHVDLSNLYQTLHLPEQNVHCFQ